VETRQRSEATIRSSAGMTGDFLMNTYFPAPTVQAMILLDEAGNDVFTAIELALINAQKDNAGDSRYWVAVADALTLDKLEN
jgi:hypothetical protein